MADTSKQEELKPKFLYFFEKKLTDLTTKFEADIDSLEKMKYEFFDKVIIKYREIEEEHKKQESEEKEKPEKEKEKPEKKSNETKHSKAEKKKIDPINRPKAPTVVTKRPKAKEEKPHDKTEIHKEKKETKPKPAVPRANTAKTAARKDTGKKPATAEADSKAKTPTTKKGVANAKKESKLDAAQQKILDLDLKFLKPLAKANVPTSIKFYFECCGIIMNKRLAVPDNFGELEINKDTKVRYYSPLGWTTMISYITSNSYGSFFDTIKEFQEKLYGNKLNINDETLELLRPYLDSKTCMDEPLFSDDVAMKIGGDACKRLAAFCRSISDYVYAIRDVIPRQQNVEYK